MTAYEPETVARRLAEEDDFSGHAIVRMLMVVADRIAAKGWDQPPRLFAIERQLMEHDTGDPSPEGVDGFAVMVSQVKVPFPDGGGPAIAGMLEAFAGVMSDPKSNLAMSDVMAWALVHEAWILTAEVGDAGQVGDMWRAAQERAIHKHARRTEVRMLLAVDRAGVEYHYMHPRDQRAELHLSTEAGWRGTGILPDALTALMEATPA